MSCRCGEPCDLVWGALPDDSATLWPPARAEVDNPIGSTNQVEIVFHQEYRVGSFSDHAIEDLQQSRDISRMEAGGRFVQYEQESFRASAGQCLRNPQTLVLAPTDSVQASPGRQVAKIKSDQLF